MKKALVSFTIATILFLCSCDIPVDNVLHSLGNYETKEY